MRRGLPVVLFCFASGLASPLHGEPNGAPSATPKATEPRAYRERQSVDILDFANVYADTRVSTQTAKIDKRSPTTLSVASGVFSSADVGKYIVIPFAGPRIAWLGGSVTSVPVAAHGANYSAVPAVTFSGGDGSGALAQTLMQISTVATEDPGSGCAAGTYPAAVAGGKFNIGSGVLAVTIGSGGTVTSVSVKTGGDYFALPTLTANSPGSISGCSVQPAFKLEANVASVLVQWGGSGYASNDGAVTASFSGGSPGTAATLGNVVATPFVAPLATTIAEFVSPTQVTLTNAASSFLSSKSVRVVWGHDDSAGINAAIASMPEGGALRFPYGRYGAASPIVMTGQPMKIEGDGPGDSVVYGLSSDSYVLQKNGAFTVGDTIRDIGFDGNRLTQFPCYLQSLYQAVVENVFCLNAATPTAAGPTQASADLSVGDGIHLVEQVHFIAPYARNDGALFQGSGDLPTYGIWVRGSDDEFLDPVEVNDTQANFRVETTAPNTWITNNHGWGSLPTPLSLAYTARDCLDIASQTWATEPGCDGARGDAVFVTSSIVHGYGGHLLGSRVQGTAAMSSAKGLEIAGGLDSVAWLGFDAGAYLAGGNRVVQDLPFATGSYIWGATRLGQDRVDLGRQNTLSTTNTYGVCAGSFSTCAGNYAFVAGEHATSSGTAATVLGNNSNDFGIEGSVTNGYGGFGSARGSAEAFDLVLSARTVNETTAVALLTNTGATAGNYNQIPVPTISGQAHASTACRLTLTGTNASTGDTAMWTADNVLFKNAGGTLREVGNTTWVAQNADTSTSSWTPPTMKADSANQTIDQTIVGVANANINWVERAHCLID